MLRILQLLIFATLLLNGGTVHAGYAYEQAKRLPTQPPPQPPSVGIAFDMNVPSCTTIDGARAVIQRGFVQRPDLHEKALQMLGCEMIHAYWFVRRVPERYLTTEMEIYSVSWASPSSPSTGTVAKTHTLRYIITPGLLIADSNKQKLIAVAGGINI